MRRLASILLLVASSARAGGLVVDAGSARAIGRAGVGTVSDDGGGALLVNPAGLARRETWRVQLGLVLADDAVAWRPANSDAPVARDQAASSTLPAFAIEGALGDWVVAVGAQTAAASSRRLASPTDFPVDSPDLLANRYQYRYAGVAGALRRDTLTVGAAHRLGDAVAIGVAVGGARVQLDETRSVWASALPVGTGQVFERDRDVLVAASGTGYAPSAVAGVLIAPTDTRVELAASIGWTAATALDGAYRTADPTPTTGTAAVASTVSDPSAQLVLHEPVTVRTGVRWAGEHWIGEVGGDLWLVSRAAQAPAWRLAGLDIYDQVSGDMAPLAKLPSRAASQTHGALRAAVDIEVIAGFLWATAGYAYTTAGTPAARLSPTFGELAGQTAAAGLEISAGDFTISLGWARTWSVARTAAPLWQHDNPFPTGDAALPSGTYDGSRDLVGLAIDAEL